MVEHKNILIIQCYNANKGDNSVLSVMLSTLKSLNCGIIITAFDPEKAEKEYKIEAYEYLFSFMKMKMAPTKTAFFIEMLKEGSWLLYSLLVFSGHKLHISLPVPEHKRGIINAYKNADLIVLPGGHFFTSFNSLANNFSHYYALRVAQLLRKKTMVYSQTVGPFTGWQGKIEKILANRVLKKTDRVTLRENDSLKCYSNKNVTVTAETVFIEPIKKTPYIKLENYIDRKHADFVIGVTIHHIYYKHYFTHERYVQLMADIFDFMLEHYNCAILVIPMEDKYKTGGDRPIIREMISKVRLNQRISMVEEDLNSLETANLISQTDLFIGTKTHSIVYGLKTATPTLSISYQQKSTEFMKLFSMEPFSIDLFKLNVTDFSKIFDKLFQEKDKIKKHLEEVYPAIIDRAEENNRILQHLLYDE